MINRRKFIASSISGLAASAAMMQSSCSTNTAISGQINPGFSALGHRLRTMNFPEASREVKSPLVIVGAGVSGLSAARIFSQSKAEFLLLELGTEPGGNSLGGANTFSSFPWGAHYLPIPNANDKELLSFLTDAGVITGQRDGLPVYNDYHLCHDPKERLFIHHVWQEGLIPHAGVPQNDLGEIQRFLDLMNVYKHQIGSDGKEAFAIPLSFSSQDAALLALDNISAAAFMDEHNFRSPFLRWYVNYCCADDYGASLDNTSAWAMIHYFASRKGRGANAESDEVLTWPEGNFWLVNQLRKYCEPNLIKNALAYAVREKGSGVEVLYYDANTNTSVRILADKVLLATPRYVTERLQQGIPKLNSFEYGPWMVCNMTLRSELNERRGEPLCWDNVIYGSDSLGYVFSGHQQLQRPELNKVITYYKPLTTLPASEARRFAYTKTFEHWQDDIIRDLSMAHPEISKQIGDMQVWLWGHGMISPKSGFIWGDEKRTAQKSWLGKIYYAHSDLSGISVFEEAFYQGHITAKAMLGV